MVSHVFSVELLQGICSGESWRFDVPMPGISLSKAMSCCVLLLSFPRVSLRLQAATTESLPLLVALARTREVNMKLPPTLTSASHNETAHVRITILSI